MTRLKPHTIKNNSLSLLPPSLSARVTHWLIVVPGPKLQAKLNHVYSSRAGDAAAVGGRRGSEKIKDCLICAYCRQEDVGSQSSQSWISKECVFVCVFVWPLELEQRLGGKDRVQTRKVRTNKGFHFYYCKWMWELQKTNWGDFCWIGCFHPSFARFVHNTGGIWGNWMHQKHHAKHITSGTQ